MIEFHPETVCEHDDLRCHFGICRREAELEVTISEAIDPVMVCSLHLSPILGWGVPEPVEWPTIRYLPVRPEATSRPHEAA